MTDRWHARLPEAGRMEMILRSVDWLRPYVEKVTQDADMARQLLSAIRGNGKVTNARHVIDLDAAPFVPDGWRVEEHVKGGTFAWDEPRPRLFLVDGQKGGKGIEGDKLRKELKGQPVLNANVLEYLLKPENQRHIPEGRKNEGIYFWGTIYRDSSGKLCVRCLCWNDARRSWNWGLNWLGRSWVFAS